MFHNALGKRGLDGSPKNVLYDPSSAQRPVVMRKMEDVTDGMRIGSGVFLYRETETSGLCRSELPDKVCADMQAINWLIGSAQATIAGEAYQAMNRHASSSLTTLTPRSPSHLKKLWTLGGFATSFGSGSSPVCTSTTELVSIGSTGQFSVANVFSTHPRAGDLLYYLAHDVELPVSTRLCKPNGGDAGSIDETSTLLRLTGFSSTGLAYPRNVYESDKSEPMVQYAYSGGRELEKDALVQTRLRDLAAYSKTVEFDEFGQPHVRDETLEGLQNAVDGIPQVAVDAADIGHVYYAGRITFSSVPAIDSVTLATRWVDRNAAHADHGQLEVLL